MVDTLTFLNLRYRVEAFRSGSARTQPQLSQSGILGSSLGDSRQTATDPEETTLEATLNGQGAESLARELEELAASPILDSIPVVDSRAGSRMDGYYSTSLVAAQPSERQVKESFRVRLGLSKRGTSQSHWRSAETDQTQLDHDWGNTTEAHVGVPASASKLRWVNTVTGATSGVGTPVATRTGEHADVDVYDANAAPVSNPSLIYEFPYGQEWQTCVTLWDTRGNASKTDANGNVVWEHVFAPQHEFDGTPVLSNGILRVTFDEANGLSAERYASGSWSAVSLGSANGWSLFDADVREIGQAAVECYLSLENTDGSTYALRAFLEAGAEDVLFDIPENLSGPVPSGIVTWLDPIASSRILSAQPERDVRDRGEVQ